MACFLSEGIHIFFKHGFCTSIGIKQKVGFYLGKIKEDGNVVECYFADEKPEFILIGTFETFENKKKLYFD